MSFKHWTTLAFILMEICTHPQIFQYGSKNHPTNVGSPITKCTIWPFFGNTILLQGYIYYTQIIFFPNILLVGTAGEAFHCLFEQAILAITLYVVLADSGCWVGGTIFYLPALLEASRRSYRAAVTQGTLTS